MNISFSGHRDRIANWWEIKDIFSFYGRQDIITPVHGGAIGFDTQVDKVAKKLGLKPKVYRPDWDRYGKSAGYVRNKTIVDSSNVFVVLWDERTYGGTYQALQYALEQDKSIIYLSVMDTWEQAKQCDKILFHTDLRGK